MHLFIPFLISKSTGRNCIIPKFVGIHEYNMLFRLSFLFRDHGFFSWLFILFERIFGFCMGLLFSQIPTLLDQYQGLLAGALFEAKRTIKQFGRGILEKTTDPDDLIQKFLDNTDPDIQETGKALIALLDRKNEYELASQALFNAEVWEKPFMFLYYLDVELLQELTFQAALPLRWEAFFYAIFGVLTWVLFVEFMKRIARMPRDKKEYIAL